MMFQMIFRKALAVLIIVLFAGCSITPLLDDSTFQVVKITGANQQDTSEDTPLRLDEDLRGRPDGLAPKSLMYQNVSQKHESPFNRGDFYAYNAYDPSGGHQSGPITFNAPGEIVSLAPGIFPNFCGGADMNIESNWFGCDYAGGLYSIDTNTGAQTYIAPTVGVNGMTYDFQTGNWYVTSSNNLYTMDVTTGETTLVGSHGISNIIIGIACDIDGNMYGYDVLFTGNSTLYSIDKDTGACTVIGDMGYGFVYAQDCGFHRNYDILYIAGYFNDGSPSALLTCDVGTGECIIVDQFEGSMEVDGLAIFWTCCGYDDDIAINRISSPGNGEAEPILPIVKIFNAGFYPEVNVSLRLLIRKELTTGTVEDFETTNGSYIHFTKLTDSWQWGTPTSGPGAAYSGSNLWATVLNGNYPGNMWSGLKTQPFVVPSGVNFKFWHWYQFEQGWDGGNVKISTDGGGTYNIINPVGGYPGTLSNNPYMMGQSGFTGTGGNTWAQTEFDLSAYEGMTAIILWETASDSSVNYSGWYIDDVGFTLTSWVDEYNETMTVPFIDYNTYVEVSFPTWTPADLGFIENTALNYVAVATNLFDDQNSNNDNKEKFFTLDYMYFHDAAITEILSPVSGLAVPQIPEVAVENHGQFTEDVNVSMTIGKPVYTTLLDEDFSAGVPPEGWGTNYPDNWYSSSTYYAGGEAPEAQFNWAPSSVDEHLLYTGNIDTTELTAVALKFKEYVNDYNGDYTLKVVTSTDGGTTWSDAYVRMGGPYGPTTTEIILTSANGIGSATFKIAWDMSGDSFNINSWYIDDVWLSIVNVIQEYNQTVSVLIAPGERMNVSFPIWTPADIPFATMIDYIIESTVTLSMIEGNPVDNFLSKLITLSYEHDVGVIEILRTNTRNFWGFPVEGIIKNFGILFLETDIPVHLQYWSDGDLIYDGIQIVPGPLAPGATLLVIFSDVPEPEDPPMYEVLLRMQTELANDDHPNNDQTEWFWSGMDIYPPNTTAMISGSLGQNGWYISTVQVTLIATDNKGWPCGVNNTFYKIDAGDWFEYITPIIVDIDGQHTVTFYSDDNCIPPNVEEIKEVSFKMDTSAPVFLNYTFTPLNFMQDEWLCSATVEDATSGISTVEFYVDDVLIGEDAEPPYECLFTGKPTNNSQGLAYDAAGNLAFSPIVHSYQMSYQQQRFLWFCSLFKSDANILQQCDFLLIKEVLMAFFVKNVS